MKKQKKHKHHHRRKLIRRIIQAALAILLSTTVINAPGHDERDRRPDSVCGCREAAHVNYRPISPKGKAPSKRYERTKKIRCAQYQRAH